MADGIRFARRDEIELLSEIWKTCFNDSEEYISLFYTKNFDRIAVPVYCVNGKPVSMMHILDSKFVFPGGYQDARLLYAGGTLPEYRGRGFFRELLINACRMADAEGFAAFFKPATASLEKFYTSEFDFRPDSYFRLVTVIPSDTAHAVFGEISYREYNRLRNEAFSDIAHAEWSDGHIRWCAEENAYFSGKTLSVRLDGTEHFLMGYPCDNTLIINETDLSPDGLRRISGSLCKLFGTELIKAYLPDSCGEGELITASVVYNTELRNTYVNQILI